MSDSSPILDQPQSIDYDQLRSGPINRLANQDLFCLVDANSDPSDIFWPWAQQVYARSIRMLISDWQEGELIPLATRFFPGHQETIVGTEGMIVTKRLIAPAQSANDRSLLWLLECQAEGDRLLRLEIDIDWGKPLSQRIVDGLLVAQRNPGPARGIYGQSNAESTRVFGNPHGRPDIIDLDEPSRARLVYHVLVNGIVEVPLIMTVSDVGEQVAWNAFLALRDLELVFDKSTSTWQRLLQKGRLWTPDPTFNRAVEVGKLEALRHTQRLRTGYAPSQRCVSEMPALVDVWDTIDLVQSRNLLAHLRRAAEQTQGYLPVALEYRPKQLPEPPPQHDLLVTNGGYIHALEAHLAHHGNHALADEHRQAIATCAEALVRLRWSAPNLLAKSEDAAALVDVLRVAARLADGVGDATNAARWQSEVEDLARPAVQPIASSSASLLEDWQERFGWYADGDRPWGFVEPWGGIRLAGDAVWRGCGLHLRGRDRWVDPSWPVDWKWWALLNLPADEDQSLSLLWDGSILYASQPVHSDLPVQVVERIQIFRIGEFDFDPYFELTFPAEADGPSTKLRFRPVFQTQRSA